MARIPQASSAASSDRTPKTFSMMRRRRSPFERTVMSYGSTVVGPSLIRALLARSKRTTMNCAMTLVTSEMTMRIAAR